MQDPDTVAVRWPWGAGHSRNLNAGASERGVKVRETPSHSPILTRKQQLSSFPVLFEESVRVWVKAHEIILTRRFVSSREQREEERESFPTRLVLP
jgi:hypothetical protein